jgi:aminoglycoside phosphotransferase (APT) family kinase protein
MGKKLFGTLGPFSVRVSRGRVIKGPCKATEIEALKYVAEHTSIPVPKVISTYVDLGRHYIEMEYIHGMNLEAAWLGDYLAPEQKRQVVEQLAGYVEALRNLKPPEDEAVGSAYLNECVDHRVGPDPFGPFHTHREFHSFLRGHIPLEACTKTYGKEVTDCHSRQFRSRFTHADLCPRNIVVRKGKVVAIIDWECAGWYPEYWEYTKAHYGQIAMPDWYRQLTLSMTKYQNELAAELALWEQYDQPGANTVAC